jgi:hypothetical protein
MRSPGTAVLLGVLLSAACAGGEPELELGGDSQALSNDDRGFVPGNVRGQPMVNARLVAARRADSCLAAFDALDERLAAEHARLFDGELPAELADTLARVELELTEKAPPAAELLETAKDTISQTDWAVLGSLPEGDIQALAFLVLMQASKSAQEDLKAIMAGVKAIHATEAKLREQLAARVGAQRGWLDCERPGLDAPLYERLSPADRALLALSLDRLAALLAALDDCMPEAAQIRPELLDELD